MNLIAPVLLLLVLLSFAVKLGVILYGLLDEMLEEALHPLKVAARGGALGIGLIVLATLLYVCYLLCRFITTTL